VEQAVVGVVTTPADCGRRPVPRTVDGLGGSAVPKFEAGERGGSVEPGTAWKVLIVEDDVRIREALAECVASLGVEVATAADPGEGLVAAQAGPRPDAILMDVSTPRLVGHAFAAALGRHGALSEIPVVAMKGARGPSPIRPRVCLRKPYDLDELAKVLVRLQAC
jgi:CheY-like chemotaxis protein